MMLIAEGVARLFVQLTPLDAYRLDIAGSLIGIVAFSALSFLEAPPVCWGLVAVLLLTIIRGRPQPVAWAAMVAVVVLLGLETVNPEYSWSPYYKVRVSQAGTGDSTSWYVWVNGLPHQAITSTANRQRTETFPFHFLPYSHLSRSPRRVLVVGAGNGTDVAIAFTRGAEHVDAVEIDPRLYQLGVQLHPDHPYSDPRVDVHIDDGRAFLQHSAAQYDLILFALPDSLTLVAGQSSLRLESYLFTREAMVAARAHLAPGGTFAEYNYYSEQWLVDRLGGTLREVYGTARLPSSRNQERGAVRAALRHHLVRQRPGIRRRARGGAHRHRDLPAR